MDPSKWRIAKACQECRARKIRCDGGDPCQRCQTRHVPCVYRKKARNRVRKTVGPTPANPLAQESARMEALPVVCSSEAAENDGSFRSAGGTRSSIHNHSVSATHRASPSVFLQLYYGPSSNFSLLNSIYHQVEGTRPAVDGTREVEEMGPGLDLFNSRRLYFGDLADGETARAINDTSAMFMDRLLSEALMDRYLNTYWHVLPIWSKAEFRSRLAGLYNSPEMFNAENPDTIIVLLAMAIGASMLEEEASAQYLFRKAKQWTAMLDDMVNIQTVQIALLMSHFATERARPNSGFLMAGVAVRKAVAAGLHKDVGATHSSEDVRQGRITIWCAFFWETWLCFSLGRPSSFPETELDVPFPTEEKLLLALVYLARLMSKCVTRIYKQHHDSLLPLWNAANDIRRELRQFAEQQRQDFNFGLVNDPNSGEVGVCQTIISTMYHHTLLLTFRPFLVLRAKLREEDASGSNAALPTPPSWLDTACEYCLDAARHSIGFLSGVFQKNQLCREIRYHGFFLEGASHALAFGLLQDKTAAGRANFPYIELAVRTLQLLKPRSIIGPAHPVDLSGNLERMVQSVYPDFRVNFQAASPLTETPTQQATKTSAGSSNGNAKGNSSKGLDDPPADNGTEDASATASSLPPIHFPFTPFGLDEAGSSSTQSPVAVNPEAPADLTAADVGWNFDFATMNMEAFLSFDPSLATDFTMYR